jgi:hypothetical protein
MQIGWYLLWPALVLAVISGSKQVMGVWRIRKAAEARQGAADGDR